VKVSVPVSEKYKILNQEKPYFVTFAVEGWVDVFTREEYRQVIIDSLKHCQKEKGLVLFAWCLMTNHIHLVIGRKGVTKMEDIVRDFKKFTSVKLCRLIESNVHESRREWMLRIFRSAAEDSSKHERYKFWQSEYHPIELDGNAMIDQKLEYIHDNPVEAGFVDVPENYLYSSARDYTGIPGLLDVEFLD
jgi:REP element-mobilizing transposase RayT